MAALLYVFPHPDDECFGPAPALVQQRRQGHQVHLLTLTRGEATRQRERLGLSKAEMGAARYQEMQAVAEALDLSSLTVAQYPDGELAELNPLVLENEVVDHIHSIEPEVVVTYPVHGVSGHPDHLVTHAIVKRVVSQLRADGAATPQRLAHFTLRPPGDDTDRPSHLQHSPTALIDCVVSPTDADIETGRDALYCYETYRPVIEKHQPLRGTSDGIAFELFGEAQSPPLSDLTSDLPTDTSAPPQRPEGSES